MIQASGMCCGEKRAGQGRREEPTGAYVFEYVRIGDDRERRAAKFIATTPLAAVEEFGEP